MPFPPPPSSKNDEEGEDSWLVTYADAITLLMAFFIMLVSFSKVDLDLYDKVRSGMSAEFADKRTEDPADTLKREIEDIVLDLDVSEVVTVSTDSRGIAIELDANAFFKPGSAELVDGAAAVLQATFKEISAPIYERFNVQVEGHTDDVPIDTPQYPSNWELSTARASTVIRFFVDQEMDPHRMKAIGFADTRPKFANRDENGEALPENQAKNRRVIIRVNRDQLFNPIKIPKFRRDDLRSVPLR